MVLYVVQPPPSPSPFSFNVYLYGILVKLKLSVILFPSFSLSLFSKYIMKFQQDIQYFPISVRLAFVPMAMLSIYIIQWQTRIFTVTRNEAYQGWWMACLYSITAITALCLVAWDQIQIPLKFMYSCFFKRIGNHGNDQQSRLESFYQDQAKSTYDFLYPALT